MRELHSRFSERLYDEDLAAGARRNNPVEEPETEQEPAPIEEPVDPDDPGPAEDPEEQPVENSTRLTSILAVAFWTAPGARSLECLSFYSRRRTLLNLRASIVRG